ncbi:disease resistance protein RPV1-like isoform X2 [Cornus florida]|nr:disease resistance protein RPV1-like isoform X2 [Cornus florida]XP_059648922.1 disease resistance protein RPV1-like isoform X2 [Cornus florida]
MAPYIVGLDFRLEELMRILDVKSNGIRVLGLHGTGGIGKTTLAKALYNKLFSHFERRSFISNVRDTSSQKNGKISLQNKLLSDLSQVPSVNNDYAAQIAIKRILNEKRVLVVLDDVDNVSQVNALIGKREWLCEGSRIIITTRDRDVLLIDHVSEVYEVKSLGSSESLNLFSYHAFRRENPTETFLSLSLQIVSLTGGLPLALEVFGSFLFDKRRVKEWEDALQKLKQNRPHDLQGILKISFDWLDDEMKCIFLDIACLFLNLGMERNDAVDIFKGCGFKAENAINFLVAKSLIRIDEDNTLWMHDQIRDMGRQIVQEENLDPGMRSRLWVHGEILTVLKNEKGTKNVQGVIIDFEKKNFPRIKTAKSISWNQLWRTPNFTSAVTYLKEIYKEYFQDDARDEGQVVLCTKSFESMVNLRLLQFSNVELEGNFKHIPAELKWLQWRKCLLKTLPSNFCPRELTVLDLSESKIERLWGQRLWFWYNKVGVKLMVMNLHGCYNLTDIPDLSGHHALEKLILERCISLRSIHKSIGRVSTLRYLNLRSCSSLVEFPSDVSGMKDLENLILSGCSKLKKLPQDMGGMNSLKELLLDGTAIEKLPESIFLVTKLERLSLNDCQSLKQLPICMGKLSSLRELSLNGSALEEIPNSIGLLGKLDILSLMWCRSLTVIPDSVGNLKSLTKFWLNGSSVKELPASIGSLSYLKDLSVGNCVSLSSLPSSIEGLASVIELQLDETPILNLPDQICMLKSLEKLEMRNCKSLCSLPKSIGRIVTLTTLIIVNAAITELPESIGILENLGTLNLNKCKQLSKLPASIGELKSLHHLRMEETAVTELPEKFGMLTSLMVLKMAKKPYQEVPQNAENRELVALPSTFSNLSWLIELDARAWKLSGKIPDDFEKLSSLEILNLGHNDFSSLPSSLRGLSALKQLFLPHCKELKVLPPLPSSLVEINAANCTALEEIPDLSSLQSLQELFLTNCEKLVDIPGLESLKSLRRLHMSGCSSCSSVKGKFDKVALKKLYNLSLPGSTIPEWFTQGVVRFSTRKNRVIESVIICVVVSVNHQTPNDLREQLPVIPDIIVKILRLNEPVYTSALYLAGVPKTHEDQVYICRFPDYNPLVSILKDGDEILVEMRNPPFLKGVELKKCGIYLVYENDDDYDGDEESLDESQQSVSEKLSKFVGFSEENNNNNMDTSYEVARKTQEEERGEGLAPANHRKSFVVLFIVLSCFFGLLSWLVFNF